MPTRRPRSNKPKSVRLFKPSRAAFGVSGPTPKNSSGQSSYTASKRKNHASSSK